MQSNSQLDVPLALSILEVKAGQLMFMAVVADRFPGAAN